MVFEFDSIHFVKSSRVVEWASEKEMEDERRGRGSCLVVLRRAQYRPLKSVAKREGLEFEVCRLRISSWNAAEARRTANNGRFHNARKSKEVLEVDGGRLLVELTCPPLAARHEPNLTAPSGA